MDEVASCAVVDENAADVEDVAIVLDLSRGMKCLHNTARSTVCHVAALRAYYGLCNSVCWTFETVSLIEPLHDTRQLRLPCVFLISVMLSTPAVFDLCMDEDCFGQCFAIIPMVMKLLVVDQRC